MHTIPAGWCNGLGVGRRCRFGAYARRGGIRHPLRVADWISRSFDALWDMEPAEIAVSVVQQALERLQSLARELSAAPQDLASTWPCRRQAGTLYRGQSGRWRDRLRALGQLDVCHPRRGEFANQTYFLTSDFAARCFEDQRGQPGCNRVFPDVGRRGGSVLSASRPNARTGRATGIALAGAIPGIANCPPIEVNLRRAGAGANRRRLFAGRLRYLSFPLDALGQDRSLSPDFLGCGSVVGARNRFEALKVWSMNRWAIRLLRYPLARTMTRRTAQNTFERCVSLLEFAAD